MNQPLSNFFSSGKTNPVFNDELLDRLELVESSGNPNAVNPKSGATGAYQFIPKTTEYLKKKYGDFDPLDREQSRRMAKLYLEELYDKTGSVEGALKAYGGFKNTDPSHYINKVLGKSGEQLPEPIQLASTDNDALTNFFASKQNPPPVAKENKVASSAQAPQAQAQEPTKAPQAQASSSSVKDLAKGVVSLADTALEGISGLSSQVAYPFVRPFTTAEKAKELTAPVQSPLGRLFGIEQDTGYKKEFSRQAMEFIGENVDKGADWLSKKTGIPKPDVESMINSLSLTAPKVAKASVHTVQSLRPNKMGEVNIKKVPDAKRAPITPEETVSDANVYAEREVSPQQQVVNAQLLKRTGAENIHESVLKGKGKERATLFNVAKTDTPIGNFVAEKVFNKEFQHINTYAEKIVKDFDGSLGMDQSSLISRGRNIEKAISDFDNYLAKETGELYKQRDELAKDIPVRLDRTKELLLDPEIATTEELALQTKMFARMKKLGIMDADGNILDNTALNAEKLRQFVHENKNLARGGLYGRLLEAIDLDVTDYAGSTLYDKARAMHKFRKETIDNPKGISSLIESDGINRKISYEDLAKKVIGLEHGQLAHIVDTLKNKMPDHLKEAGQKALAEIKSQYLNTIIELGNKGSGTHVKNWNAQAVTKFLKNSNEDLKILFTPEEISKLYDLNDLGQRYRADTGYPGAAVQKHMLESKGFFNKATEYGALAAIEYFTGGSTFGVAGNVVREKIAARNQRKAQQKKVAEEKKKLIPLNEIGKGK